MAEKNLKKSKLNSPKTKDKKANKVNGSQPSSSGGNKKKHIVFNEEGDVEEVQNGETHTTVEKNTKNADNAKSSNKKILFNEDGKPVKENKKSKKSKQITEAVNIGKRWFELVRKFIKLTLSFVLIHHKLQFDKFDEEEVAEIKDAEINEMEKVCKAAFEKEFPSFEKSK